MNQKTFNLWHRISAIAALVISAVTYLLTIEPSASFWDCGEFIASSYKLEVGHPPGNPVFQLIARVFTMFGDNMHAAVLVNAMSALCSAFTIFFLYLTIVWLAKRLVKKEEDGSWSVASAIAVIGSGLVGSLAYCFSDTFWFSAVEGEVYAMSSLFTAAVFWLMTMWYDRADEPHSLRWIVLIAFLMGLSIGVHLLNLLAIPALVFMFYYRQREEGKFTFWELVKIFLVGVVILGVINFILIPYLPKLAAYVDLFFVNVLGLPYNVGAAFFMVALVAACFWGIWVTMKKEKVFLNTALLCLTTIIIGFSIFSIDIIRSCAKTPTNEYQPDNAFTLVRYLSREQYGSTPLIYGQYYNCPYDLEATTYWAPLDGKYKKVQGPVQAKYHSAGKMLFPRMWSDAGADATEFYHNYTRGKGSKVAGAKERKPSMGANLAYFFDYQMNWMYWRYFMWNFAGRQNDIHSPSPGDIFHGNWESGVKFIDDLRLGDQSDAPALLAENKAKNHYFFLPLLLGLLGLFFQFDRDKRGTWLTFLMFFITGIAIVIYLNQPPFQVRERDYAYAGSFYFFSVWIGLAVAALVKWTEKAAKKAPVPAACVITAACLCVPALMAAENWDDHDRSNRRTAVELAYNYLNSVDENGILITHGDNDTFPLWYAQEVEGIRTDVRVVNTSLLGTDWHIDQMKWASNESKPLPLKVSQSQYLYGTNEYIPVVDNRNQVMAISDVMSIFRHPDAKVPLSSGRRVDYIASRKISVPVNVENAVRYRIIPPERAAECPQEVILTIPEGKEFLTKPELFLLDLLSNYEWDRPICFLSMGGDLNVGVKEYFEFTGYSFKFVPFKSKTTAAVAGYVDPLALYNKMTLTYKWDAVAAGDYFIDYQNMYTNLGVMSLPQLFANCASTFIAHGRPDWALQMLDKCQEVTKDYPLETIPLGFSSNDYMIVKMISMYFELGKPEKAHELAERFSEELLTTAFFYRQFYSGEGDGSEDNLRLAGSYIYYLVDELKKGKDTKLADKVLEAFQNIIK